MIEEADGLLEGQDGASVSQSGGDQCSLATEGVEPSGASAIPCQDCGVHNPVWFAPSALWNLTMGGPEATGDPGGIICPNCFILRAERAGIVPSAWLLQPEAHDG